jgi:hypothetical protein
MNAISPFAQFLASESASASATESLAPRLQQAVEGTLDTVNVARHDNARLRDEFFSIGLQSIKSELLEEFIIEVEERERSVKAFRSTSSRILVDLGKKAESSAIGILPLVESLAQMAEMALIERLEVLRDARMAAIAELASRPQDVDGPILSSQDDIKAYFAKLSAA